MSSWPLIFVEQCLHSLWRVNLIFIPAALLITYVNIYIPRHDLRASSGSLLSFAFYAIVLLEAPRITWNLLMEWDENRHDHGAKS